MLARVQQWLLSAANCEPGTGTLCKFFNQRSHFNTNISEKICPVFCCNSGWPGAAAARPAPRSPARAPLLLRNWFGPKLQICLLGCGDDEVSGAQSHRCTPGDGKSLILTVEAGRGRQNHCLFYVRYHLATAVPKKFFLLSVFTN